jgi:hypothetical protein
MQDVIFDSRLLSNGNLYCPEKFVIPGATFKVIVTLPDEAAADRQPKMAAADDREDEPDLLDDLMNEDSINDDLRVEYE